MINIVLTILATVLVQAFALNVAKCLVSSWTWVITLGMPKELRDSHRAEVNSDMHEEITHRREEGHAPSSIAAHMIFRLVTGLKDHLALVLPYAPETIPDYLRRGSVALSGGKPNSKILAALTVLLIANFALVASEDEWSWVNWVFWNACVIVMARFCFDPVSNWVRWVMRVVAGITFLALMGLIAWVVVQERLYEAPFFTEAVVAFCIVSGSFWWAVSVGERLLRGRTIRERGLAVAALVGATILGSFLAASLLPGTGNMVGSLWLLVGLIILAYAVTGLVAMVCAIVIWRSGTWLAAKGMRALADAIRPGP